MNVNQLMGHLLRILVPLVFLLTNLVTAADQGLSVFTSADPDSNAVRSFIVVPAKYEIPHGIGKPAHPPVLGKQAPFRIELLDDITRDEKVQWSITITKNAFGGIRVRSSYSGQKKVGKASTSWTSFKLDYPVRDRKILLFQPRQQRHLTKAYEKGKPVSSQSQNIGGGTEFIDVEGRNPRLTYIVEARIIDAQGNISKRYNTTLQMDNKDLIRQEYINHYNITRSSDGETGKLPVPSRDEIRPIPPGPEGYVGNPLTESQYQLMIENGALDLCRLVLDAYEKTKALHRQPGNELRDLNGRPLTIPDSPLWLSNGWRNPERNEWFSDELNSTHQLGTAVDLMPSEIPRKKNAAIVYWVLWKALESIDDRHQFSARLEALNVTVKPASFKLDIEPKNGIPDAFDQADHLHINLIK